MKRLLFIVLLSAITKIQAQNIFKATIKDEHSKEALVGATAKVKDTTLGAVSDASGLVVIKNVPNGIHTIEFSFVGYEVHHESYEFPLNSEKEIIIYLVEGKELEEVIVTTTRSSRTIEEVPSRIEFLGAEELTEKAVMNSTNIAMLLRESTGIQMQQTSASSANQSIRIQGLDGRYTQILRDGFPLFGGFSGGLSIMQIPPLDLKQVEVIKGSASTLYGGGAIAGIVNLVSKRPEHEPELSLMLNQTSASGTTVNGFYAQKFGKAGISAYVSANRQDPYDPNDDGFSDIPEVRSFTFNPKFYWNPNENTDLTIGINSFFEDRIGGDLLAIDGKTDATHSFTENNDTERYSTQIAFNKKLGESAKLSFRNSVNYFDRSIKIQDYQFAGRQVASYSELNYQKQNEKAHWIIGANLFTDDFKEEQLFSSARDYQNTTVGAFAQNTVDLSEKVILESGIRADYNSDYGLFFLPRVSALFRFSDKLSGRLGGGLGYKIPTIFTEDSERLAFRGIAPFNKDNIDAEKSLGGNLDLNYKTTIGEKMTFSVNQLFYYTQLKNSLVFKSNNAGSSFILENAVGNTNSRGFETNIKLTYGDFKLFLQYAFIDVTIDNNGSEIQKPLTPKHNAGAVLVFEQHGKWRIGFESYYTGQQYLSDNTKTRDYWIVGLMGLRQFKHFSFFLNFENFIDTRQSRYQDIVTPPINNPTFSEIWAPTDGFVINGGFIWNLFSKKDHH